MHYKKLLKTFVLFSFCLKIVYASSSYIVEEEPRLISNVMSSYSAKSSMTNRYSLWNKVKQTVSSFLIPSYETLQTSSSFENQNSSWWEAPTLKSKKWEEQWNTMVMFVVQDNLEHSRLLASTTQYRKAVLASPEGINLAKYKKLSKILGFEAQREAIQDKLFNTDARHLHLTKYSQFLACFRAEERHHLNLFRNILQDFYQKVESTTISGDYYDGDLFQKGNYLAKCLWEIGKLERKAANLHILKNIIRQSYTAINGGIVEAWLYDKLKAVNVITPSKPILLTTSSIKGPFFLFFTLSASLINVASALNRGGSLSNACSDTYKGCETGFTLLDFYDSNPEVTSLLSNNLFLNATQQALLEPNRVTALNNMLEISNILSNTTGWYSEVTAFSVNDIPTGNATREIYSLPAPFMGSRYSIINSTAFHQDFYQIYDVNQPVNNSNIFTIKYSYPASFFFTDQFPHTEIWFFPVMMNSSFGLSTAVMRPSEGNPYLLWQRAITSDSSNNRADTLNLSGKLLDTNTPTRAFTEQGNTPDDLALLHHGFVGEPDCQGNQTISQYLNFQSPPVATLANSFISCMQKTGLDPLACPRTTAQYPSLVFNAAYFRLSYFFMENNLGHEIFTRKVVDGPNYQSCIYTELGSQQTEEICYSYIWAPYFDKLNSTSRVINQNLRSFSGSLIPGHVHKIFEYFFSNPSTDGIVVHTMQNVTGVFGPNYYAYCTKQGFPSSNPTIINSPTSSPTVSNEPISNPADSSGLSDGEKAAIGVSVSAAVLGTSAGILGYKLKKDKEGKIRDQELGEIPTSNFNGDQQRTQKISVNAFSVAEGEELEDARMKINGTMYGHKYGLYFQIDRMEAEEIAQQTGLKIQFPDNQDELDLIIGSGGFGQVRIARQEGKGERKFRAIKIVVGNEDVKDSLSEGVLQETLNGKQNVLPILEYLHYRPTTLESRKKMAQLLKMAFGSTIVRKQDKSTGIEQEKDMTKEDLLLQVMPLAAFGDGWTFQEKIAQLRDHRLKNKLLTYVAYSLLTGLRNIHDKNISHLDVKPSNFLIHTDGTVYVNDFGCARPGDEQDGGKGDIGYLSPERLLNKQFSGKAADAWGAGVTLLEIVNNAYPFNCEIDLAGMLKIWNKAYYEKALSDAFAEAKQVAILPVLKGLLAIEPQDRWSMAQAQVNLEKLLSEDAPALLFHQLDDALLENGSYSPREAVNNNDTHTKRRYKSTSQDYRAYHEVQQNYNKELTLVPINNNNSRSYLVPKHNNK